MKLQYLGDSRDAFKWDLLHWLCTTSSFTNLVYVPLLTPDKSGSTEGRFSPSRFECQKFIRPFLESLKIEPRSLHRIANLGLIHQEKQFKVHLIAPDKFITTGISRRDYWNDFAVESAENSVIFLDPDTGFETQTQRGTKWVLHTEMESLLARLPATSVLVVYQHRPRRIWRDLFEDMIKNLGYCNTVIAVNESTLAFLALAANGQAGKAVGIAFEKYAAQHAKVKATWLRGKLESSNCHLMPGA